TNCESLIELSIASATARATWGWKFAFCTRSSTVSACDVMSLAHPILWASRYRKRQRNDTRVSGVFMQLFGESWQHLLLVKRPCTARKRCDLLRRDAASFADVRDIQKDSTLGERRYCTLAARLRLRGIMTKRSLSAFIAIASFAVASWCVATTRTV